MNRNLKKWLWVLAALGSVVIKAQEPPESFSEADLQNCMDCHGLEDIFRLDENGNEGASVFIDQAMIDASVHAENSCFSCHSDVRPTHPDDELKLAKVDCASCHEEQSKTYQASVHALALKNGDLTSPTCVDCHGTHDISPPSNPDSPLHWTKLPATCGACHPAQADDVNESVHGLALAKNIREAPSCTDCHSEHNIQGLKDADPVHISKDVCSRCHDSERIATKFKLPADRASTFFASYHGLAAEFGLAKAANCASCHGYHLILPSTDERSIIHPANLVQTCGECHPGATENFASSKIHVSTNGKADIGSLVNTWVRTIYIFLIVGTIGFMLFHNGVVFSGKWRKSHRITVPTVTRMDLNQRLQHALLAISFTALAISGFALEYPNSFLAWLMGSDEEMRRLIHRIAAVAMLGGGVFHIFYLLFTKNGRKLFKDFLPGLQDVKGLGQTLQYWLRLKGRQPTFARFGYVEKMEYWAVIWGTIIMTVTGFLLWFKIGATEWMPRWIVDVAKTIHYYEAILAVLAIIVWHFYHVLLDPGVYPMNGAWWNGKAAKDWYEEEHGLDPILLGDTTTTDSGEKRLETEIVTEKKSKEGKGAVLS